jgi:hypothetical protein
MIDLLAITPAEQRMMRALIGESEYRRREIARKERARRDIGKIERGMWLAENTTERDRPWLAEGISRATWYRRRQATG